MDVKKIVIHRSESPYGNLSVIDKWHRERGFDKVGYHWIVNNCFPTAESWRDRKPVFDNDGAIEVGRAFGTRGAHVKGYNNESVGICLIGMRDFTSKQFASAVFLIGKILKAYPDAEILGHYELDSNKGDCPSINMDYFRSLLG
ncbi:MAG: N-acetylmuramoyl-L-alanine amidase [Candidatus Brocadiales bacterium]|nr:N-acetylmuramoyl-L-alanine amidase [Candidatus Brocadiales bacterium]